MWKYLPKILQKQFGKFLLLQCLFHKLKVIGMNFKAFVTYFFCEPPAMYRCYKQEVVFLSPLFPIEMMDLTDIFPDVTRISSHNHESFLCSGLWAIMKGDDRLVWHCIVPSRMFGYDLNSPARFDTFDENPAFLFGCVERSAFYIHLHFDSKEAWM